MSLNFNHWVYSENPPKSKKKNTPTVIIDSTFMVSPYPYTWKVSSKLKGLVNSVQSIESSKTP